MRIRVVIGKYSPSPAHKLLPLRALFCLSVYLYYSLKCVYVCMTASLLSPPAGTLWRERGQTSVSCGTPTLQARALLMVSQASSNSIIPPYVR